MRTPSQVRLLPRNKRGIPKTGVGGAMEKGRGKWEQGPRGWPSRCFSFCSYVTFTSDLRVRQNRATSPEGETPPCLHKAKELAGGRNRISTR